MFTTSQARTLLIWALVSLAAVGCSSGTSGPAASPPSTGPSLPFYGSTEKPSVPANFTTYDGGAYSFAYPKDWKLVERPGNSGPLVIVEGPTTSAGLAMQFIVGTQENYAGDMNRVVNAFEFIRTLPEQEVVRNERVLFGGTVEAQYTDRTYNIPTAGGEARARMREIRLITPQRLLVTTGARTSEADFAGSALPAIFDSFRLVEQ